MIEENNEIRISIESWEKPSGRIGVGFDVHFEDSRVRLPIPISKQESLELADFEAECQ